MINKDLIAEAKKKNAAALAAAMGTGDQKEMETALANFMSDVHDAVVQNAALEAQQAATDSAVLAARGLRVLTSEEKNYYGEMIARMKSKDPAMAMTNWNEAVPVTIIDSALDSIRREHPLLDRLNLVNTSYQTKIVVCNNPAQAAAWGEITSAITQELQAVLKKMDVTLLKLSAFMVIPMDVLELGPTYIDQYVRATMFEAAAYKLEVSVVDGTGKDEPIGMTRDVSSTASVQDGVYPRMQAVALKSLKPKELGAIVKKLARTPGKPTIARIVDDLIFLCNPFDYWGKIMPATCYRKPDGTWLHDLLPIPADILQTVGLSENSVVIGIPKKYFVGLGVQGKNGAITESKEAKFFEDMMSYKLRLQANARPMDEYAFVLCDITDLEADDIDLISVVGTVSTKEESAST